MMGRRRILAFRSRQEREPTPLFYLNQVLMLSRRWRCWRTYGPRPARAPCATARN